VNVWDILGWTGNACFFSRFLVQWIAAERAGRSVVPRSFWRLSLIGSAAILAYAWYRSQWVLYPGYVVNAAIYARNLHLQNRRDGVRGLPDRIAGACAAGMIGACLFSSLWRNHHFDGWMVLGLVGQAIWSSRFVVQWWVSERRGESIFPASYWWTSLVGNAVLLAYTMHLQDAVLIAGMLPGPIVQVRNLMILGRLQRSGVSPKRSPAIAG
jgi:lipid-A-disaccharide synthase-like uncharacterized protein